MATLKTKSPRLKGSKTGGEALIKIKAPAQGGEAGDDETPSETKTNLHLISSLHGAKMDMLAISISWITHYGYPR